MGTLDDSGLPTVPSDLGEEIRELLGATEEALAPAAAGAGGAAPAASVPLPAPELPASSAAALLARSGAMPPSRRTSAVLASLEAAEVAVLGGARLPLPVVYATALARLAAIAPPGHYRGPLGALRRTRLWWRVHGMAVAVGAACVVLGAGVVALCVFVPIVVRMGASVCVCVCVCVCHCPRPPPPRPPRTLSPHPTPPPSDQRAGHHCGGQRDPDCWRGELRLPPLAAPLGRPSHSSLSLVA